MPVVNPDPSTEATFTPDHVPEGMLWDSPPESPNPTLVTLPESFWTLHEGQPTGMADVPSLEDIIKWEGSHVWTMHLPAVPDFIKLDPAGTGLRRHSRVTSKPAYHINYMVPISPQDEFLDTLPCIQQLDQSSIFEVRLAKASDKRNAASKDGQDGHAHLIAAAELAQTAQKGCGRKDCTVRLKTLSECHQGIGGRGGLTGRHRPHKDTVGGP